MSPTTRTVSELCRHCVYDVRSRRRHCILGTAPVAPHVLHPGRITWRRPSDNALIYLQQAGGRATKCGVMFSDISNDELLSATQLIESTDDLCACDVSVDELVSASQQFDVSSLYDDDAMSTSIRILST